MVPSAWQVLDCRENERERGLGCNRELLATDQASITHVDVLQVDKVGGHVGQQEDGAE